MPNSYPNDNGDGDSVPHFKDLDSDNDGIPDVVEAGGTDANGDGIADDFVDTDNDGYNDVIDGDVGNDGTAENSALALQLTGADSDNDGAPDTYPNDDLDGDGVLNQYDLDADGDGILDVIEAGGTDANRDGIADGFTDTDGDGYHDGLDGDVGNDGTAENAAAALINTGADTDNDGLPDTYPEGDFDGDHALNFIDVDADNDGIYDIYEAQTTSGYVAPSGLDDDGDGIDNAYDDDDLNFGGAGAAGLVAVNTDSGTGDTAPDYLDTDADGDGVPDQQEAWDSLFDGDSRPDSPTGSCSTDADGDGLADCYDSNDSDAKVWTISYLPPADDGTGGLGSTTSVGIDISTGAELDDIFPANNFTGSDNTQPDYRDNSNVSCATSQTVYAITAGGTAYEWDGSIHSNGVDTDVVRATAMCEKAGGWYRFYNPLEPGNFLFSVQNGTNTVPLENVIDYIEITVNAAGPVKNETVTEGLVLMNRAWNVVTKGSLNGTVNVRFYYQPSEFSALQDSANAMAARTGGGTNFRWFKIDGGVNYGAVPAQYSGYNGSSFLNLNSLGGTASAGSTDGTVSDEGNASNYVQFDGLTGFSGGTFGSESNNTLPVEMVFFTAQWEDGTPPHARLVWQTGMEANSDFFAIERMDDSFHWQEIGREQAAGFSALPRNYTYLDAQIPFRPTPFSLFYRLRQVDKDGSFRYSSIVELQVAVSPAYLIVSPNPFSDELEVRLQGEDTNQLRSLYLVDAQGKVVWAQNARTRIFFHTFRIKDLGALPEGAYFLVAQYQNGKKVSTPLIRQK